MTTVVVSILALVAAIVFFVGRRQRNQFSSDVDSTASRQAASNQHRHDAERHFASRMASSHQMPNGM
ncbi:hypothetical protein [Micromonospora carbonacea]|uniref:hypothetical protein n=1 Tax=Micromonospora carbonacea TaxID=47853 RepID=UPI003710E7C5